MRGENTLDPGTGISGPYILTGGNNGFEGSVVTVAIGVAVGVLLLLKRQQ